MRNSRFVTSVVLACVAASAAELAGQTLIVDERGRDGRPLAASPGLEVRALRVDARIVDQVAVTEVEQIFFNSSDRRLEGSYLYPLPAGARLDALAIDVNGRDTAAELVGADEARRVYEDIVRRMRDPALLEYAGRDLIRVRVFPVEPHAEKRVRLRYTAMLASDGGLAEYRVPLAAARLSEGVVESLSVRITLTAAKGLAAVYSPSHAVEVRRHGASEATVGYEAARLRPERDLQVLFSTSGDAAVGLDLLAYREKGEASGSFILLASPPAHPDRSERVARDVVFVVDTSGSMADGGKLEQAKRALRFGLTTLDAADRFTVLRFATEVAGSFEGLVEATPSHRAAAERFVDALTAVGGTALDGALRAALAPLRDAGRPGRPYLVVLLTDGRPTIGDTDVDAIVSGVKRTVGERAARVFCFGLGTDVNTHLLDRLAEETRAATRYVLPGEDLELPASRFFTKVSQPVLSDVSIQVSGGVRISALAPAVLPDLFVGEQLLVLGRYEGSGAATLTVAGSANGRRATFARRVVFPSRAEEHAFIPRLWAVRRVGSLLDQMRLSGESDEVRREVVELARRYGVVTPYTAYLVVEDEALRDVPITARALPMPREQREEAGRLFQEAKKATSGDAAVAGAMAFDALKRAESTEAPAVASRLAHGRGAAANASEAGEDLSAEARYVAGRTFYRNAGWWVDSRVQERAGAGTRSMGFASSEYFELLRRHPEVAPWLALGRRVRFVLDNEIVEIAG